MFCGEPAAEFKNRPGHYRKYCGDLCMKVTNALGPAWVSALDHDARRFVLSAMGEAENALRQAALVMSASEPVYTEGGYPLGARSQVCNHLIGVIATQVRHS